MLKDLASGAQRGREQILADCRRITASPLSTLASTIAKRMQHLLQFKSCKSLHNSHAKLLILLSSYGMSLISMLATGWARSSNQLYVCYYQLHANKIVCLASMLHAFAPT